MGIISKYYGHSSSKQTEEYLCIEESDLFNHHQAIECLANLGAVLGADKKTEEFISEKKASVLTENIN